MNRKRAYVVYTEDFFNFIYFKLEGNCFTILCWFLPYNQHESATGIHMSLLEPPSHLPPHPTLLGCQGALGLTSLYHAAKSHWLSILHMVMYMFLLPSNPERWCCESAALNMPANLENSAVATGLEKVSFHPNPKERQCQRMLKLPHNCTHLTRQ